MALTIGISFRTARYKQYIQQRLSFAGYNVIDLSAHKPSTWAAQAPVVLCEHLHHAKSIPQKALPTYGVLSLTPYLFDALKNVVHKHPTSTCMVEHITAEGMYNYTGTIVTQLLWHRHIRHTYEKALGLMVHCLQCLIHSHPLPTSAPRPDPISVPIKAYLLLRYAFYITLYLLHKCMPYKHNYVWKIGATSPTHAHKYHLLPLNNTYAQDLCADPFSITHAGQTYVFFEHIPQGQNHGHISYVNTEDKQPYSLHTALKTDYHLSYPFIFKHQNHWYMLPETSRNKRLELWRATDFPTTWELHQTTLEGISCADSSVITYNNTLWLFTTISFDSTRDHNTELHIFRLGDNLLNDMTPHQLNPVKIDATTARGGGALYTDMHQNLIRPSQYNIRGHYGYGLNLMRVTQLSLSTFEERLQERILPHTVSPQAQGVHHLSRSNTMQFSDILLPQKSV